MSDIYTGVIYTLVDPRTQEIRYVGKSVNGIKRAYEHFKPSSLKEGNTHKNQWVSALLKQNLQPLVGIAYSIKSNNKAVLNDILYKKEQEFIKLFFELGINLTNSTDGGPGAVNRKLSDLSKQKMSDSAKKRAIPKALLENQKSKYPENIIEDEIELRFCRICVKFCKLTEFKKDKNTNVRICRVCFNTNRKSRIIPGARAAYAKKLKIPLIASNENETLIFNGFVDAVKYFGGKTNKLSIRKAINHNRLYRGFYWKELNVDSN
jgi:hypothetical protein